jgi:hypothetical protein
LLRKDEKFGQKKIGEKKIKWFTNTTREKTRESDLVKKIRKQTCSLLIRG